MRVSAATLRDPNLGTAPAGVPQAKAAEPRTSSETRVPSSETQTYSPEDIAKAIDLAKRLGFIFSHQLNFLVHEQTGRIMVRVVDAATGEMIAEIPPKKMLDLAAAMREIEGILFDRRV